MKKSIRSTRKLTGGKQLLFAFARHAGGVLEISGGGYLIKKKQTKASGTTKRLLNSRGIQRRHPAVQAGTML
jgi:hypothetical protein